MTAGAHGRRSTWELMGAAVHAHKPRKALGRLDPNTLGSSKADAIKPFAKPSRGAAVEVQASRTCTAPKATAVPTTTVAAHIEPAQPLSDDFTAKCELLSPGADVDTLRPRGAVVERAQERLYYNYGRAWVRRRPEISPRKSLDASEVMSCSAAKAEGERRRESNGSLPGSGNLKEKIKSPQAARARGPTPTKLVLLPPARAELSLDLEPTASHEEKLSEAARSIQAAARNKIHNHKRQRPLDSKLSEAQRQNMLLVQRLRESQATIARLQQVTSSLQAPRPSNGASPEQPVASVVVSELKSVERHVVETHDVRPTIVDTPPISVQLRWLLEQEALTSAEDPSDPAELLSPSQPKQLQLLSPAPPPNSSQRRAKSTRPGFRSPNSMLQSMVHGLRTPARLLWRRSLVVVNSSPLKR